MKKDIKNFLQEIKEELIQLSDYILENPELGFEEHKSSKALIEFVEDYGFNVEKNFLGFETAFKATYESEKEGPTICYLAEYDALPDIGHGCGHNMIGTAGVAAGIALKQVIDKVGGKIIILGTPAEETNGVKVDMVNAGVFKDIDVAMMVHPSLNSNESGSSLAMCPLKVIFRGKPAHAASMPDRGINALDACIQTFNGINAMREHILPTSRIHGIITEGGVAVNIVPERAVAIFSIRSPDTEYRSVLKDKVISCAKGAAEMTGAQVEIIESGNAYDSMITNKRLSKIYMENFNSTGAEIEPERKAVGSLDMGNVSQVCPSIHPYFGIFGSEEKFPAHTEGFRDATKTKAAYESMMNAIYALATTGLDIIGDKELLDEIKKEFNNR